MDRHPLDRPLASDKSYEIAEFRREHPELEAGVLDSSNQKLHAITARRSVFDGFVADRPGGVGAKAEWHIERQRRRLQG